MVWLIIIWRSKEIVNPELAIIIPTFNEKNNIQPLLEKLNSALYGINWEVIYVDDDSKDGTADTVREISKKDSRVKCIQRIGRRGLASACIEGMLVTAAPYLAVMDADLQHDETKLIQMLDILKKEELDVVVGSRYVKDGETGDFSKERLVMSRFATSIGHLVTHAELKDPMSGFFMITRNFFNKTVRRLTGKGFKILLDLFASSPDPVRFKEIPFKFRTRLTGESKLSTIVLWEYLLLIVDKLIGKIIPVKFILFVMVGACGAVLHILTLGVAFKILDLSFMYAQVAATIIAMTVNFMINNMFTYRDRKLRGDRLIWGLLSFYLACSIGAFVNIRIASFLYSRGVDWWGSGLLGAVVGSVWNYAITKTYTWDNRAADRTK
ncbi:MAG: glycosyltransferase family 2 protein [Candidatus Omnitrophica bacterium]|nr:glycosyltransferase family 2 protein [Candidatus Omnitrophota bacterium]